MHWNWSFAEPLIHKSKAENVLHIMLCYGFMADRVMRAQPSRGLLYGIGGEDGRVVANKFEESFRHLAYI